MTSLKKLHILNSQHDHKSFATMNYFVGRNKITVSHKFIYRLLGAEGYYLSKQYSKWQVFRKLIFRYDPSHKRWIANYKSLERFLEYSRKKV